MSNKRVYLFREGNATMRNLLGGKGANLAEMTNIGLPVPEGFTITTEACIEYINSGNQFDANLMNEVQQALQDVENSCGKQFGSTTNPLLVSVRSGARFSMPGMMETILNLGLNDTTVEVVANITANQRFAYDSYRRFLSMFGGVVLEIPKSKFEHKLEQVKASVNATYDTDLTAENLQTVVKEFKQLIKESTGKDFPQEPMEQLKLAIEAVFKSWNTKRAIDYRNHYGISHSYGTAVNVQIMVFGNKGNDSATGVAFTRNPSNGNKELYGEYLVNAQGEDVVAGIRTPKKLSMMQDEFPELYTQFKNIAHKLENHYKDVQDMEFTIEQGRLYMLQTRNGKRTAAAAVKIAVDLYEEGIISKEEALLQVDASQLPQLLLRSFDSKAKAEAVKNNKLIATGLNASPGAATGKAIFDPTEAESLSLAGQKVILVREETCPDDIHGMIPSQGILTSRGGMTSHAAVVARGMGKPCVAGCETLRIDMANEVIKANNLVIQKGEIISIDGTTGEVFVGDIDTIEPKLTDSFTKLLEWADEKRKLRVRANADTPEDAIKAFEFGAEGIGLCRTEHMFMAQDRLEVVHSMILAETQEERVVQLNKLLPMQRGDFKAIFKAMSGYPVTIRLLDPPLHEFLPNHDDLFEEVVQLRITSPNSEKLREREILLEKVRQQKESNPMMGFRGCRLGIIYPEIYEMQVRAVFEAAVELQKQDNITVVPEIMIPLIGHSNELKITRQALETVAKQVMDQSGVQIEYLFGTMIEVPRAAIRANAIAEYAEFFSFGTNDLTQMTFGYSRDDAEGKFLTWYVNQEVLPSNPFNTIDEAGVGELVKIAIEKGRSVKPNIKLGICGEHGGEAKSVKFFHRTGLNYVSSSPYRVPVARLAAAQAVIEGELSETRELATV